MARVPYLDPEDLAPGDRDLLQRQISLYRALVNSPGMARAVQGLGRHIRYGSALDARLRELAILQVGYLARSPYEYSHHAKLGIEQFGVTPADIAAVVAESEGRASALAPLDRMALRAAREMHDGQKIADDTWEALAAELPRDQLVDLVVTIGHYCGIVRILATLEIDVEDDYAPYLERFPLPSD